MTLNKGFLSESADKDSTTPKTDALLAAWPSTMDTQGDADRMQSMVSHARWLERQWLQAVQDRDARAREACTAEGRTGCSYARTVLPECGTSVEKTGHDFQPPVSTSGLNEVWCVANRTSSVLFESQEMARAYVAQFGAATSGGLSITNMQVFRAPASAKQRGFGRPMDESGVDATPTSFEPNPVDTTNVPNLNTVK